MTRDKYLTILAEVAVSLALQDGLQPSQRTWAVEFFKRDPLGFVNYVCPTAPCPVDRRFEAYVAHLHRRIEKLEAENERLKKLKENWL